MMYDPAKPYKKEIIELIKKTWGEKIPKSKVWKSPYFFVYEGLYPVLQRRFFGEEIDHVDGIGTKGFYHWQKKTLKNAVLDALRMNWNDIAMLFGTPLKIQNHITLPKEDKSFLFEILEYMVEDCNKYGVVISGGETSIHDNNQSLDISVSVNAFRNYHLRPNSCKVGDYIVGFQSNSLHSNGFTKIRELFGNEGRPEFTEPTADYLQHVKKIMNNYERYLPNGLMHITGGAFTKIKDILKKEDVLISKEHNLGPQPIYHEIYGKGVSDEEMYKTFNCGIGFVMSAKPDNAKALAEIFGDAAIIGEVVKGNGKVRIESMFSDKEIVY